MSFSALILMKDLSPPKLSYFLRKTGETSERNVCVRHFHKIKDTEFVRATGVKVEPTYFDHVTGKVSGKLTQAPEWETAIHKKT